MVGLSDIGNDNFMPFGKVTLILLPCTLEGKPSRLDSDDIGIGFKGRNFLEAIDSFLSLERNFCRQ